MLQSCYVCRVDCAAAVLMWAPDYPVGVYARKNVRKRLSASNRTPFSRGETHECAGKVLIEVCRYVRVAYLIMQAFRRGSTMTAICEKYINIQRAYKHHQRISTYQPDLTALALVPSS